MGVVCSFALDPIEMNIEQDTSHSFGSYKLKRERERERKDQKHICSLSLLTCRVCNFEYFVVILTRSATLKVLSNDNKHNLIELHGHDQLRCSNY